MKAAILAEAIERLNEMVSIWLGVESDADCLSAFAERERRWLSDFVAAIIARRVSAFQKAH